MFLLKAPNPPDTPTAITFSRDSLQICDKQKVRAGRYRITASWIKQQQHNGPNLPARCSSKITHPDAAIRSLVCRNLDSVPTVAGGGGGGGYGRNEEIQTDWKLLTAFCIKALAVPRLNTYWRIATWSICWKPVRIAGSMKSRQDNKSELRTTIYWNYRRLNGSLLSAHNQSPVTIPERQLYDSRAISFFTKDLYLYFEESQICNHLSRAGHLRFYGRRHLREERRPFRLPKTSKRPALLRSFGHEHTRTGGHQRQVRSDLFIEAWNKRKGQADLFLVWTTSWLLYKWLSSTLYHWPLILFQSVDRQSTV